jgi:hypothetical protein
VVAFLGARPLGADLATGCAVALSGRDALATGGDGGRGAGAGGAEDARGAVDATELAVDAGFFS